VSEAKKDYLIFDSDCGFCQKSIGIMKNLTGEKIAYKPSFEIDDGFYGITRDSFNGSIKFFEHKEKIEALNHYEKVHHYEHHDVHEDAIVYHGAYAIFKALSSNPVFKPLLFAYKYIPLISVLTEAGYRIIARNRMHISKAIGADACKIN
jgi:predicted DCC family thiol-disulfide oxidoreductase YuxK